MHVGWVQTCAKHVPTCAISNPTAVGTSGCEKVLQIMTMMMQVVVTKLAGWCSCSCGWGQRQAGRLPYVLTFHGSFL